MPRVSHLNEILQQIHSNRSDAARRGRRARANIIEKYSIEAMSVVVSAELSRIREVLGLPMYDSGHTSMQTATASLNGDNAIFRKN
jgi:hypothetical protein